jgi:hypothetical protein
MWFQLKGDERITHRCASEGCGGQPTWKLEADGVGSFYCSGCKAKIELPMLKPKPGEITVECPKCHQRVSETCCAYQDFDYYKNCHCYITRPGADQQTAPVVHVGLDGEPHRGMRAECSMCKEPGSTK